MIWVFSGLTVKMLWTRPVPLWIRPTSLSAVEEFTDRLRGGMGAFPGDGDTDPWAGYQPADDPLGAGVVPLLALVATADDLAAFHRRRGFRRRSPDRR